MRSYCSSMLANPSIISIEMFATLHVNYISGFLITNLGFGMSSIIEYMFAACCNSWLHGTIVISDRAC